MNLHLRLLLAGETPGTQVTLVLVGKGLVLRGIPSNIQVIWALGICIYIDILYI